MALCQMYFAPPGAGKTTLAAAKARYFLRKGFAVFTNFPCYGCFEMDSGEIGKYHYKGVCIIDEAGIDFNNRDWKKFTKEANQYVKLHRHYHTNFLFFSQGWDDCDKKIRTLCTEYFYLKKLGPFTFYRLMAKRVGVDDMTKQIIDEYYKVKFFRGGIHFIFRPKYYKYFDSWDAPPLPPAPRKLWDVTTDTKEEFDYKADRDDMIEKANRRAREEAARR